MTEQSNLAHFLYIADIDKHLMNFISS